MEHLLEVTFADFPIHRIDPGGVDPDPDLTGKRVGPGRVFINQDLRTTIRIDAHRLHRSHAPVPRMLV
jgi:hypothetical protein